MKKRLLLYIFFIWFQKQIPIQLCMIRKRGKWIVQKYIVIEKIVAELVMLTSQKDSLQDGLTSSGCFKQNPLFRVTLIVVEGKESLSCRWTLQSIQNMKTLVLLWIQTSHPNLSNALVGDGWRKGARGELRQNSWPSGHYNPVGKWNKRNF